jgi:N,N'-diacetyllegionaminate synthase
MASLNDIIIDKHIIGVGKKPLIIAEIGVNHNGCINLAKQLIDAAKNCGADVVKFQTFKAERLASQETPKVDYQKRSEPQKSESHFEMLKRLELSFEDTDMLKKYCDKLGVTFMSTPYDIECVEFLNEIGVSAYKVASADLVDYRIHRAIQATKKPVIQSVGMCDYSEIEDWLKLYEKGYPIVLLQCTANYPSDPNNSNLRVIEELRKKFNLQTGFSDHTSDDRSAFLSVAMGSVVIERHFTLDCKMDGPDHKASTEPTEFKQYCESVHSAYRIMGSNEKFVVAEEKGMRSVSRKGVYLSRDLEKGEVLKESDIKFQRPSTKYSPLQIMSFLGSRANKPIKKNMTLLREDFDLE